MACSEAQARASDSVSGSMSGSLGGRSTEIREVDYWLKRYCAIPTCGTLRTLVQSLNAWLRSRSAVGPQRQMLPDLVQFIQNESKLFGEVGLSLVDLPSINVFLDVLNKQGLLAAMQRFVFLPNLHPTNNVPFSVESPRASLMPYRIHLGQTAGVMGDVRGTLENAQLVPALELGKGKLPIVDELTKEQVERYAGWQKMGDVQWLSTLGMTRGCFLMKLEPNPGGVPRILACTQLVPEENNDTTSEKHSLWLKLNKLFEAEIAAGQILILGQNPKKEELPQSYSRWTVGQASIVGNRTPDGDFTVYMQLLDKPKQSILGIYQVFPEWVQIQ